MSMASYQFLLRQCLAVLSCLFVCLLVSFGPKYSIYQRRFTRPDLLQFQNPKIGKSVNFEEVRNVVRRILLLDNWERVGRVCVSLLGNQI